MNASKLLLFAMDIYLVILSITGDMDMFSNDIKVNNHHGSNFPCTDCKTHAKELKVLLPPKQRDMYDTGSVEFKFPCDHPLYTMVPGTNGMTNKRDSMHLLDADLDENIAGSTCHTRIEETPHKTQEGKLDALSALIRQTYASLGVTHDNRIKSFKVKNFAPASSKDFPSLKLKCVKMKYFISVLRNISYTISNGSLSPITVFLAAVFLT